MNALHFRLLLRPNVIQSSLRSGLRPRRRPTAFLPVWHCPAHFSMKTSLDQSNLTFDMVHVVEESSKSNLGQMKLADAQKIAREKKKILQLVTVKKDQTRLYKLFTAKEREQEDEKKKRSGSGGGGGVGGSSNRGPASNAPSPVSLLVDPGDPLSVLISDAQEDAARRASKKRNKEREIRFGPKIGRNDLITKVDKAFKILGKVGKVNLIVFFKRKFEFSGSGGSQVLANAASLLNERVDEAQRDGAIQFSSSDLIFDQIRYGPQAVSQKVVVKNFNKS